MRRLLLRANLPKYALFMTSLYQKHGISIGVSMLAVQAIYCQYSSIYNHSLRRNTLDISALRATGSHVGTSFTPHR